MRVTPVSAVLTSNLKVWESSETCFTAGTPFLTFPLQRILIWTDWSFGFFIQSQYASLRILHILKLVKYLNVWNNLFFCLKIFEKFSATFQNLRYFPPKVTSLCKNQKVVSVWLRVAASLVEFLIWRNSQLNILNNIGLCY